MLDSARSGTLARMDEKTVAVDALRSAFHMFRQDLEALPDGAYDRCFGGKARTVADIVHEVNLVNDHVRATVCGAPLFEWPNRWITAPENQRTKAAVMAAFDASAEKAVAAFDGIAADRFMTPMDPEDPKSAPLGRLRFLLMHCFYHSGQLNFIQTLLGDDAMHWA